MESVKVKVRRRINKNIDGNIYWKWYLDIPSQAVKELGLKLGTLVTVEKAK